MDPTTKKIIIETLKIFGKAAFTGIAYGFAQTCFRVYNAASPTKALIAGVKGIIIDCTPPVIKYPLLCAGALSMWKPA